MRSVKYLVSWVAMVLLTVIPLFAGNILTVRLKVAREERNRKRQLVQNSPLAERPWSTEKFPLVGFFNPENDNSGGEKSVNKSRTQNPALSNWPTAGPAEMGLRSEVLDGTLKELLGANKTGAAVLAVKGKLVWEHYWNGFGPSSRFDLYSAGKAYAAAAIGLLMDDGKVKVDDPACSILTEWSEDERRKITIRHLLTMTSGLKLDLEGFTAYENALDVTDKGTALLWRTILSAFQ